MPNLSKSSFVTGCQCPKLLWWTVHEPLAEELQPDKVLLDRFDQGRIVGELARQRFPGGVLVAEPHQIRDVRLAATRAALDSDAPAIFEGGFQANGVYVGVDALVRGNDGLTLIEAKSTTSLKDEHIPDAAIQAWVLREAGVPPARVEVMHLNKDYRHPDQGDLFVRTDVTEAVAAFMPSVPGKVAEFAEVLAGALPRARDRRSLLRAARLSVSQTLLAR